MQQGVWRVGIVSSITLGCLTILSPARSQIVPDTTLPTNSSVTSGCTVCTIEGGTVRGVNLFHSFSEFSVPTGGEAFFNNPAQIENILTRVTGSNISNIDGLIRANDAANLFLVNPNGIIFGVNSRLDIGGSFFASTADSLVLENGAELYQFSASNPTAPPLLTITAPIGLQFGSTGGSIVNQSRVTKTITNFWGDNFKQVVGLEVQPGKTLGLIGGNVTLAGGISTAPSGRIELGSVADKSFVRLISQDKGFALGYEGVQNFGDIQLSQAAQVNAQDVIINARRLLVQDGSSISAFGTAANLIVNASDSVELMGIGLVVDPEQYSFPDSQKYSLTFTISSRLSSSSFGLGGPANLTINTGRLLIQDGANVSAFGTGANLIVNASDLVEVIGSFDARYDRTYQSGDFISDAFTIPSSLSSSSYGLDGAANVTINTEGLLIRGGASVSADDGGSGKANLIVNASDFVQVIGFVDERREYTDSKRPEDNFFSTFTRSSSLSTLSRWPEEAVNLVINTERLLIQNGASVSSVSSGSRANLTVKASESVQVIGSVDGRNEVIYPNRPEDSSYRIVPISSSLSSSSYVSDSSGGAANLMIHTGQLLVQDQAQVRVFAYSFGNSFDGGSGGEALGNLRVSARSIRLDNQARIGVFAQASNDTNAPTNAPANAGGNITLEVEDLVLRHNSEISTISFNLTSDFSVPNNLTPASDDSVNVIIDKLNQARNSGNITGITDIGNLGNITINAGVIAAIPSENSDIIAFNTQGGGNVTVTAQRIFGLRLPEFPGQLTDNSDITSSGTVTINTLDVDPSRGLTKLPEQTVDRTQQIAQDCAAVGEEGNKFIITGRGGLPQSPEEVLTRDTLLEDLGAVVSSGQGSEQEDGGKVSATSSTSDFPKAIAPHPPNQLVEAQGWIMGTDGQVMLTAQAPTPTLHQNWQPPVNCQVTLSNSPP